MHQLHCIELRYEATRNKAHTKLREAAPTFGGEGEEGEDGNEIVKVEDSAAFKWMVDKDVDIYFF